MIYKLKQDVLRVADAQKIKQNLFSHSRLPSPLLLVFLSIPSCKTSRGTHATRFSEASVAREGFSRRGRCSAVLGFVFARSSRAPRAPVDTLLLLRLRSRLCFSRFFIFFQLPHVEFALSLSPLAPLQPPPAAPSAPHTNQHVLRQGRREELGTCEPGFGPSIFDQN